MSSLHELEERILRLEKQNLELRRARKGLIVEPNLNILGQQTRIDGRLNFTEITTPSTPASGQVSLYAKDGGLLYTKDDLGIEKFVGGYFDGWIPINIAPVYVSATSIRFENIDLSSAFPIGTKIKFTQMTVKYFYVIGVSYSGGHTVLTVTGGSNYSVANAAITAFNYAHGLANGFPEWFSYSPTWTGTTTNPAIGTGTLTGKFNIIDRMVKALIYVICTSTTTYGAGNYTFGLPIAPSVNERYLGQAIVEGSTGTYIPQILGNNAYLQYFYKASDGSLLQMSPTTPKTWNNGTVAFFDISYRI